MCFPSFVFPRTDIPSHASGISVPLMNHRRYAFPTRGYVFPSRMAREYRHEASSLSRRRFLLDLELSHAASFIQVFYAHAMVHYQFNGLHGYNLQLELHRKKETL